MNDILQRLAQGPGAIQQGDTDSWNQMVGSAPPQQFGSAAANALSQLDPNEYANHVQPGAGGTDPLGSLAPNQLSGVAQSLLGALTGRGLSTGAIAQGAGVSSLNPQQMSSQDLAGLLQWTQQNHPQALGNVAAQYQNQPGILSSILGNKALMGTVEGMGANFIQGQIAKRTQK